MRGDMAAKHIIGRTSIDRVNQRSLKVNQKLNLTIINEFKFNNNSDSS